MSGLKEGLTTGTCATAAAKGAARLFIEGVTVQSVDVGLPGGRRETLEVFDVVKVNDHASASVIKDSGDDPDVTNGMTIKVTVSNYDGEGIKFEAGEGVGRVTKKGLSIQPGEPAINPVPRVMIRDAIREVTDRSLTVTVSIVDGERVGAKTFNPRLGIVGGLSILGTTGIVRPYSHPAIKESLRCLLNVAIAGGAERPAFTAGNIGTRAAVSLGMPKEHIVEVGNEWGFMLDSLEGNRIKSLLAIGHPGKLVKLIAGDWDTHSSRSKSAIPTLVSIYKELFNSEPEDNQTAEGFFKSLDKSKMEEFAAYVSVKIVKAIEERLNGKIKITVALINMECVIIGHSGGLEEWRA